ncbi:unnamed protein product [Linum trigynum]|uniref:Gnk2-homologous domain-containing protein n=1 Tax=Linum trigynum TaxID=586398 RepID=A0AAV2EGM5_9ROSI
MKNTVQKLVTLVALMHVITAPAAGGVEPAVTGAHQSKETSCFGAGASHDYEAHKQHVLEELANVTPTVKGYDYSTAFPPTAGSNDVVYGYAGCSLELDASDCSECLEDAKDSLLDAGCDFDLFGIMSSSDCSMRYNPAKKM